MAQQVAISPRHFRRTLTQIILLPVALLAILVVVFLLQLNSLVSAARLVSHTDAVIREAGAIEESLLDQQVNLRGYLITGEADDLALYRAAGTEIDRQLLALSGLVSDNAEQTARVQEVRRTYEAWLAFAEPLRQARPGGTTTAAINESERRVRTVRTVLDTFVGVEQTLLDERNASVERSTRLLIFTSIASIFVIGGGIAWAVWRQVTGLVGQYDGALGRVQRQAAALRESESRFRNLANALPQVVWTTYPDGNISFLNQRWYDYTGTTPESGATDALVAPIHPDDWETIGMRWAAAMASSEPFVGEYRLRNAAGDYRWHLVRAVPVRGEDATIAYWVGAGTDIDDHKRAEDSLRERSRRLAAATRSLAERNRELDQFAYVTSHDLKAPLRGISNLAQWIEEDLGDLATGDIRQQLELLRGRAQRMEALIEGILQFSRIGRVKETVESVDVGMLLEETVDLLAPPPGFTIAVAPGMPTVVTERTRLQQVFANLIGNALKHHGGLEGRIAVQVGPLDEAGYYQFAVADDGPGIALQYHERIFGIFQTLRPRDQVEGSGLGLALIKKIIEHHGGRIWLESAEGSGTTFYFTWPQQVGREEE